MLRQQYLQLQQHLPLQIKPGTAESFGVSHKEASIYPVRNIHAKKDFYAEVDQIKKSAGEIATRSF